MKLRVGLLWGAVGLTLLAVAVAWQPQVPGPGASTAYLAAKAQRPGDGPRTPVIVELFTSEGCSSCPPADALLARLEKTQPVPDAEVIALKEHVDYWNHLGWRDPYSSTLFSARQNAYARALGNAEVYTPQMIVDGGAEVLGSDESRVRQAIARAARAPKAGVRLEWASAAGDSIPLRVRIEPLTELATRDTAEAYLAVTEGNLHSDIARGENAGRRLDHFAVVRELKQIGRADPRAATAFSAEPMVRIAPEWKRTNLRVVVFLQEVRSWHVLAAASIAFPQQ